MISDPKTPATTVLTLTPFLSFEDDGKPDGPEELVDFGALKLEL